MNKYNFKNNIFELSITKNEWEFIDKDINIQKTCICNHIIKKNVYYYFNELTLSYINVGSGCVKKLKLNTTKKTHNNNLKINKFNEYNNIFNLFDYSIINLLNNKEFLIDKIYNNTIENNQILINKIYNLIIKTDNENYKNRLNEIILIINRNIINKSIIIFSKDNQYKKFNRTIINNSILNYFIVKNEINLLNKEFNEYKQRLKKRNKYYYLYE